MFLSLTCTRLLRPAAERGLNLFLVFHLSLVGRCRRNISVLWLGIVIKVSILLFHVVHKVFKSFGEFFSFFYWCYTAGLSKSLSYLNLLLVACNRRCQAVMQDASAVLRILLVPRSYGGALACRTPLIESDGSLFSLVVLQRPGTRP